MDEFVRVYARVRVCVCARVCVRKRKGERERGGERKTMGMALKTKNRGYIIWTTHQGT